MKHNELVRPPCAEPHLESDGDGDIDVVVVTLRSICRDNGLEFALRVGAVIIHHFYCGETDVWRSRGPKLNSFRRLAQHPDLPMSPSALYRCVALFELCERLGAVSRWRNLGVSHLRAVLGLPPQVQQTLLSTANAQRWSVQSIEEEVRRYREPQRSATSKRPQPQAIRRLSRLHESVKRYCLLAESPGPLAESDINKGMELIEQMTALLTQLSKSLRGEPHLEALDEAS